MTHLISHELFENHDTGGHPESAHRITRLRHLVDQEFPHLNKLDFTPLEQKGLEEVHSHELVQMVKAAAATGGGSVGPEALVSPMSYETAAYAAGAACTAAASVLTQRDPAVCLIRPPGHHATANLSQGFCLFNNVAIAAKHLLAEHQIERILIVDWDVHHGNGTQAIFYDDPRVMFYSLHRFPFYPGSGSKEETGTGAGLGFTLNNPIAYGTPRAQILAAFRLGLEQAAAKIRPEVIIVSAGFDAHIDDPLGSLDLYEDDFAAMTKMVTDVAACYCPGRILSCLEGGYELTALEACVRAHVRALEGT